MSQPFLLFLSVLFGIEPVARIVKTEMVTGSICQVLASSNIRFGCHDRFMTERNWICSRPARPL